MNKQTVSPSIPISKGERRVLSFGAGVNSTAILILHKQGKLSIDAVIFADTGAEHPETYEYIDKVILPLCKKLNLPFIVVGSPTLFEDYWNKKIIPYRAFRSCTDRYKIRPIRKYIKEHFGEAKILLGIDAGESHRAKYSEEFAYPLIDLGINREGCKEIIRSEGYKLPIKSGCYFCPFTKLDGWKKLLQTHRTLFLQAEAFEKNCRAYPKYCLSSKPLRTIRRAFDDQHRLTEWIEQEGNCCVFCHE